MLDRRSEDLEQALDGISDGATIAISGFGESGRPNMLIKALLDRGTRDITLISNNAGEGTMGLAALLLEGRVRRLLCSFPRGAMQGDVERLVRAGALELEVMPQGTLAERLRAGGAGIPAFYTATGYGTQIANGKESRTFGGRGYLLETALTADFGLIKAHRADRWGNLTYRNLARNFCPLVAAAAKRSIVEADEIVPLGDIPPAEVITPGIFTDVLVQTRPVPHGDWPRARVAA